jgi:two-component system chemotaxis sensor kinase CheA
MTNGDINKELLIGFIDESIDSLNTVDSLFVKLESNPSNMEIVNAIFRPIHSLKGTAAYFGLMKLKKLAHTLENLLDLIRKGSLQVDRSIIDILLPGVDSLRVILANVRNDNSEVSDEKSFQAIISIIEKPFSKTSNFTDNDIVTRIEDIISHLSTQVSGDGIESLGKLIQLLSSIPALVNLKLARAVDKKTSLNQTTLTSATDNLYNILNKTHSIPKNSEAIKKISDLILKMSNETSDDRSAKTVTEIVDLFDIFTRADTGLDSLAISLIMEKLTALKTEPLVLIQSKENCGDHDSEMPNGKADLKNKHDKTMRIPEQSLDDFLRCVGELLGVEEMLRNLSRQINSGVDTNALSSNL